MADRAVSAVLCLVIGAVAGFLLGALVLLAYLAGSLLIGTGISDAIVLYVLRPAVLGGALVGLTIGLVCE